MPTAAGTFQPYRNAPRPGGPRIDPRPNAAARGYDEKCLRLMGAYRKQHPHCERCLKRGVRRPTQAVDHKVPFRGLDDPLRLAWKNLESLCRSCHGFKTAQDKRNGAAAKTAEGAGRQ